MKKIALSMCVCISTIILAQPSFGQVVFKKTEISVQPGFNTYSRELVDVNNDGRDDLVLISSSSTVIYISIDDGFQFHQSISLGDESSFVDRNDFQFFDLNNDGYGDIIGFSASSNILTVWLNDQSGIFTEVAAIAQGVEFQLLDTDQDGEYEILIFSDNGDFSTYEKVGVAFDFTAIGSTSVANPGVGFSTVSDVDNDGLKDVIVATTENDHFLRFFKNLGDGSFSEISLAQDLPLIPASTPLSLRGIKAWDVNDDFIEELYFVAQNGDVFINKLDVNGNFELLDVVYGTSTPAPIRLRNDDLYGKIIHSQYSGRVNLMTYDDLNGYQVANDVFPDAYSWYYSNYGLGDIDNDGFLEAVFFNDQPYPPGVYEHAESNCEAVMEFSLEVLPINVTGLTHKLKWLNSTKYQSIVVKNGDVIVAELAGDANEYDFNFAYDYSLPFTIETLCSNGEVSSISRYFTEYEPVLSPSFSPTWNMQGYVSGDFDQDGDVDLVGCGNVDYYLENDGSGLFFPSSDWLNNPGSLIAKKGDLDGDGDFDLVSYYRSGCCLNWTVYIRENSGNGEFITIQEFPLTYRASNIDLKDVDGDQDLDVFLTLDTGQHVVLVNHGVGNDFEMVNTEIGSCIRNGHFFDYDGEGNQELLLLWYCGDPSLRFFAFDLTNPAVQVDSLQLDGFVDDLEVVDIDADGSEDACLISNRGFSVLKGPSSNSPGVLFAGYPRYKFTDFEILDVKDCDNDGDLDVLVKCYPTGDAGMVIYKQNSAGDFINSGSRFSVCSQGGGFVDVDGDGDVDVVGYDSYSVTVYLNNTPSCNAVPGGIDDCDNDGVNDNCQVDTDGDGVIDPCDDDLDGDGISNSCDIDQSQGEDCDSNGVLDVCDFDCDQNGVPDACDILNGGFDCDQDGLLDVCKASNVVIDCNDNGIPDNCELTDGSSEDCNGNGSLDECDLANGYEFDCDLNGQLDVCDISEGTADCDLDGVPDSCQSDSDSDGTIDPCDDDLDGDGIPNSCDVDQTAGADCDLNGQDDSCQDDLDSDGEIDPCDADIDGDGIPNSCDLDLTSGEDCDQDGQDDSCQPDGDADGEIDPCDPDLDNDGILNACDPDHSMGEDCNSNGILDSCDISGGAEDNDSNGIPDECEETQFIRGDVNGDSGIDISDAITVLGYLFTGGSIDCEKAADSNDDGAVNVADGIQILGYLFSGTGDPPAPFPDCGGDPTVDSLGCEMHGGCP